jgi:hypothetical protein
VVFGPPQPNDVAPAQLRDDPRRLGAPDHVAERRHALASPGVRDPYLVGRQPQHAEGGPIDVEVLDDAAEALLDVAVHRGRYPGREHGR